MMKSLKHKAKSSFRMLSLYKEFDIFFLVLNVLNFVKCTAANLPCALELIFGNEVNSH